jgi:hypothetical protein
MNERLTIFLGIIGVGLFFVWKMDKEYKKSFTITPFIKNFIRLILLSNLIRIFYITISIMNGTFSKFLYPSWGITSSWLALNHLLLFGFTILFFVKLLDNDDHKNIYKNLIIYFHFIVYTTFLTSVYSLYKRVFDITEEGFSIELLYGDWFFIILPLTLSFIFILFNLFKKSPKIDE